MVVFPVVTGASGRDPFYVGWPDVALDTVDHRTFDGRLQLMEYIPRILESAPVLTTVPGRWGSRTGPSLRRVARSGFQSGDC